MVEKNIQQLMQCLPQAGRVEWLGIRPQKKQPLTQCESVYINESGLQGDHYAGRSGRRSVTLIQAEHIDVIASLLHRQTIAPEKLRRNIVVKGINLLALKDREFLVGEAVLKMTGLCHPCSRMEAVFGEGGYNAVRGHGGITASVVKAGKVNQYDKVAVVC